MGRVVKGSAEAVWSQRVDEQRRSGLSVAEYCRQHEVSPASFYSWRKRLSQAVQSAAQGSQTLQPPLFVPVELPTADGLVPGSREGRSASALVQIDLPGGAIITLPAEASADLVATVIRTVISAATSDGLSEESRPC